MSAILHNSLASSFLFSESRRNDFSTEEEVNTSVGEMLRWRYTNIVVAGDWARFVVN